MLFLVLLVSLLPMQTNTLPTSTKLVHKRYTTNDQIGTPARRIVGYVFIGIIGLLITACITYLILQKRKTGTYWPWRMPKLWGKKGSTESEREPVPEPMPEPQFSDDEWRMLQAGNERAAKSSKSRSERNKRWG